jgi:hypothetical protein
MTKFLAGFELRLLRRSLTGSNSPYWRTRCWHSSQSGGSCRPPEPESQPASRRIRQYPALHLPTRSCGRIQTCLPPVQALVRVRAKKCKERTHNAAAWPTCQCVQLLKSLADRREVGFARAFSRGAATIRGENLGSRHILYGARKALWHHCPDGSLGIQQKSPTILSSTGPQQLRDKASR